MALRDQPYIPLYVRDFETDEKLRECSAESHGVYIRIMLLLHKTPVYGQLLLEQKYQQTIQQSNQQNLSACSEIASAFALKLQRHLPFTLLEIQRGICELIENDVLQLEGNTLSQKRMLKDGMISEKRASAGKKSAKGRGGVNNFVGTKTSTNKPTKKQQNTVTAIVIENDTEIIGNEGVINNTGGGMGDKNIGGEEDIDKKINNYIMNITYEVSEFLEVYFKSPKYAKSRENLAMRSYLTPDTFREWAIAFNEFLINTAQSLNEQGETIKQEDDWVRHFALWLNKQDLKRNPKELYDKNLQKNGKSNSANEPKIYNQDFKQQLLAKLAKNHGQQ